MDRENCKRKAKTSPGEVNTSRGNKARKSNPPEASGTTQMTGSSNSEAPRGSDLTQQLVAMWVSGTHGNPAFMTQEARRSIALQDAQQKCSEAENVAQMMRNKLANAEAVIDNLKKSLRSEEIVKTELISKMNLTGDLASTTMEHINYITDTLQRCQQHKDHLSDMFNNIILKQRERYVCLKNHEDKLQDLIKDLQSRISILEKNLEEAHNLQEDKSKEIQRALNSERAELAKTRDECLKTRKQLEELEKEKKEIESRLTEKESNIVELEKKIAEYEDGLKNLKEQLAKSSASLECIGVENTQIKTELAEKIHKIQQISEDLESALKRIKEQSVEISTITDRNHELEEKIKCEINQRQSLEKDLEVQNKRNEELAQQVEKLKDEKDEAVREIKKKIECAEGESKLLLDAKKEIEELESKHERLLKIHVEKYESCLAEIKLLEARHDSELSRASTSSNSALQNATTENRRLEEVVSSLKREKNDLQVEMKQIEALLMQHTNSEKQLRIKLEKCQAEAARHADAATRSQAEKKREEEEKQDKISKIMELEKELLNLQFNRSVTPIQKSNPSAAKDADQKSIRSVTTPNQSLDSNASTDSKRKYNRSTVTPTQRTNSGASGEEDRTAKERGKKPPAVSTYKKSILKRKPTPRKTRSSPPSPVLVAPPISTATERKITFNFDSSSEGSPVKLSQSAALKNFMDSDHSDRLFDEIVSTGRSSSQPMQSSQTLNSQGHPAKRRFFQKGGLARASQSK